MDLQNRFSSPHKGIILAGGGGTRLYPSTLVIPKPLLPVYDRPMIYYPLSVLMLAGITRILIVSAPDDQSQFKRLLGDGSRWGISISHTVQPNPAGIADAYRVAAEFLDGSPSALILGDNLFSGLSLRDVLSPRQIKPEGATIFAYYVNDPDRFGVINFSAQGQPVAIEEKPPLPLSNWAVTGLYFCDSQVGDIVANLNPSERGELEIADVIRAYLDQGQLEVKQLGSGFAWFDMGTPDSLLEASSFVQTSEKGEGLGTVRPEEIALSRGLITDEDFRVLGAELDKSSYGQHLLKVANQRR
jgi:glucose-1-phosphate thymidylyltransferase